MTDVILKNFLSLCEDIDDIITRKVYISSETMRDFSKLTLELVRNNISTEFDEFSTLYRHMFEWWSYELVPGKLSNLQRDCSYIQIFQIVCMVSENNRVLARKNLAIELSKNHHNNKDIIKAIKKFPGITKKELKRKVKTTEERELQVRLNELEVDKIIISRREGDLQYYMLTLIGEDLHTVLCENE